MRLPFAFAPISHNAFPPSYPPAWIVDLRSGHPRLIAAFSDSLPRLPRVRVWKWGIPASRRCTARATPSIGDSIPLPIILFVIVRQRNPFASTSPPSSASTSSPTVAPRRSDRGSSWQPHYLYYLRSYPYALSQFQVTATPQG